MKNKPIIIIVVVLVVFVLSWASVFYWQNLRGALPAVLPPVDNIANLVDQANQTARNATTTATITPDLPSTVAATNNTKLPLKLPNGFTMDIYARGLDGPRAMIDNPDGALLASLINKGEVVALPDNNNDGVADKTIPVLTGLSSPHGLALNCTAGNCQLFVAETNAVSVYDYDPVKYLAANRQKIIDLPSGAGHFTRTLLLTKINGQDKLLISVGSSCNVCNETNLLRAKVLISDLDGNNLRAYASGLRNSVFMASYPVNGEVWATDNGRDYLGDNLPPDEVNIIQDGKNYGWPICYGNKIHDTNFDHNQYFRDPCADTEPPHIEIQAHSAPLGLAFFPSDGSFAGYGNDLLVAYHGSWNRTQPTGYKIVHYKLDKNGQVLSQDDFITGWLSKNGVLGRPVGILIRTGGLIFITDDKAGVIYRLQYNK